MVDEIDHLWDMPPSPGLGCLVADRYLCVFDTSKSNLGSGAYHYAIVDLQTSNYDMFDDTIRGAYSLQVVGDDVWVLHAAPTGTGIQLSCIHAPTGARTALFSPVGFAGVLKSIQYLPSTNTLYWMYDTNSTPRIRFNGLDLNTGLFLGAGPGGTTTIQFYADVVADRIISFLSGTATFLDPEDLSTSTGSQPYTGSSVNMHPQRVGNFVVSTSGSKVVRFDMTTFVGTDIDSGVAGSYQPGIAQDGRVYMAGTNTIANVAINTLGVNTTAITDRGNRGTAIPVGNKVYVPAATRP